MKADRLNVSGELPLFPLKFDALLDSCCCFCCCSVSCFLNSSCDALELSKWLATSESLVVVSNSLDAADDDSSHSWKMLEEDEVNSIEPSGGECE